MRDLQALAQALQDLTRTCRAGQPTDRCPILTCLEKEDNITGRAMSSRERTGVRTTNDQGRISVFEGGEGHVSL